MSAIVQEAQPVKEAVDEILNAGTPAMVVSELPTDVIANFAAFRKAIGTVGMAADQVVSDRDELDGYVEQRLIDPTAYNALIHKSQTEAAQRRDAAFHEAAQAHSRLITELENAALPTLVPERETAARADAEMAMRNGDPVSQAIKLAASPHRDVAAFLLSPSGALLLESKGVEGQDYADAQRQIRKAAVDGAKLYGATDRERAAVAGLEAAGKVSGAVGAVGTYFDLVAGQR
jgi:hypothetical protein